MALQWVAADLASGRLLGDLTGYEPDYPFRHTISSSDTATGTLYLADAPADWPTIVRAGSSVLACYDDQTDGNAIQWAGYVTFTDPQYGADALNVTLSTLEGYLSRRFVRDVTYAASDGWGHYAIIADLIANWIVAGLGSIPGVALQVNLPSGAGVILTEDLILQNSDNATVSDRINSLIGQHGGEFAITWAWAPDQSTLIPTLTVGDRIGAVAPAGLAPAVTFEVPGPAVNVQLPTDYSDGNGANVITAYSSAQGSVVPYAPDVYAAPDGRPVFEYRYEPDPAENDPTKLAKYAAQAAVLLGPGARPLSLMLARDALGVGQQYGTDWGIGDDVGYAADTAPAYPEGLGGVARAIAVEFTDQATLTPIFAQPEVYVVPEDS